MVPDRTVATDETDQSRASVQCRVRGEWGDEGVIKKRSSRIMLCCNDCRTNFDRYRNTKTYIHLLTIRLTGVKYYQEMVIISLANELLADATDSFVTIIVSVIVIVIIVLTCWVLYNRFNNR